MDDAITTPLPDRAAAKASRRAALLDAAAALFAEHGFNRVSMEELGAAAGVSGPAVYRHFDSKASVLAALLTGVSSELLDGGAAVAQRSADAADALRGLVAFHVDFALAHPDVIRVQDRDLASVPREDQAKIRSLQRQYVSVWVNVMSAHMPGSDGKLLRRKAHAVFGLINSTPHSARSHTYSTPAGLRGLLERMAWAALNA